MSFVVEEENFQELLRVCNTNVEGKRQLMFALTKIKGIGRRYANLICKKVGVNPYIRAGSVTTEQMEALNDIIENPQNYKMPQWFVNRPRDFKTATIGDHKVASTLDIALRDDFTRLKKIKSERGLRHAWGIKVRGQHTKSTGRGGRNLGVAKKK
eukprot:CAMPEP_0117451460 /NCGR_PEP_ID=MMETSP0759-20121206/9016_1 /TAXON_ID=63605 /ORGANISM="Percolomonas cosmopolitus, Strain WS" /LENGTH=154 /DNA_ID=CAMNT_0005244055 /DNA_START=18 /DNA_END=482 /DNA_ORIENTATION=+